MKILDETHIPRRAPLADGLLEQRLRSLTGPLDEARTELDDALLAGNMTVAKAAARRLASVGYLLREAADKSERPL